MRTLVGLIALTCMCVLHKRSVLHMMYLKEFWCYPQCWASGFSSAVLECSTVIEVEFCGDETESY